MSKHRNGERERAVEDARQRAEVFDAAFGPRSVPVLQLRIHFQKAINAKLSGLAALGGMQGLSTWQLGSDKILSKDAGGMLIDFDGRCAFLPWANIAWIEHVVDAPKAAV